MPTYNDPPRNAKDIILMLADAEFSTLRRRDMPSAISRACQMMCCAPGGLGLEVPVLRQKLAGIRPAAHGISAKTFSNVRSAFVAAMDWAGVTEPVGRGAAKRDPVWSPLVAGIAHDERLSTGLAAVLNCAQKVALVPATSTTRCSSVSANGWRAGRCMRSPVASCGRHRRFGTRRVRSSSIGRPGASPASRKLWPDR
jgi:hypothetical protein